MILRTHIQNTLHMKNELFKLLHFQTFWINVMQFFGYVEFLVRRLESWIYFYEVHPMASVSQLEPGFHLLQPAQVATTL